MKKTLLLLLVSLAFSPKFAQTQKASKFPLANLITEFEKVVKWSAVVPEWKDQRDKWGNGTLACSDAACIGKNLVIFESYTTGGDVNPAWVKRREAWIKECNAVKSNAAAAKLLVEFESYVSWESVEDSWKKRREGWMKECAAVK